MGLDWATLTYSYAHAGIHLLILLLSTCCRSNTSSKKTNRFLQEAYSTQVPLAHIRNPSYSEGRDQEDPGLKPAQVGPMILKPP
jgi:hypothetical protein